MSEKPLTEQGIMRTQRRNHQSCHVRLDFGRWTIVRKSGIPHITDLTYGLQLRVLCQNPEGLCDVKLGASPQSLASIPAPWPGSCVGLDSKSQHARSSPTGYLSGCPEEVLGFACAPGFRSPLPCSRPPESAVFIKTWAF